MSHSLPVVRVCLLSVVWLALASPFAPGQEEAAVMDRFVGSWKVAVERMGPEALEKRKLTTSELVEKSLHGRYLIGREVNPDSGHKFLWFMTYDTMAKNYAWTFFNTQDLRGTQWRGTWNAATSELVSKSSDAPATWTSESRTRFTSKDSEEGQAWMKNDQGKSIFEISLTKTRLPATEEAKIRKLWSADAKPDAEQSPQLKVLQRLIGSWDVTSHAKVAEWTPAEEKQQSKVVREWILNRQYVQDVSRIENGPESISLTTFDPQRGTYRAWWFNSEGHTSKSAGEWDEAGKTLRFAGDLPDGLTARSSAHFTDDDHHEWNVVITGADGKKYFDCEWKCVRGKK